MSALRAGQRVRFEEHDSPEWLRDGAGTIMAMDGEIPLVGWDTSGWFRVREVPELLVVVEPKCSYAKEKWVAGENFGVMGMIVLCDVHKKPANGGVYEADEIAKVTGLCHRFPEVCR